MKLQIKVTHKLLHNSRATDKFPPIFLGAIQARVGLAKDGLPIKFSKPEFDLDALVRAGFGSNSSLAKYHIGTDLLPVLRIRAKRFLADSRYPISWSEDNCIETEIRELA